MRFAPLMRLLCACLAPLVRGIFRIRPHLAQPCAVSASCARHIPYSSTVSESRAHLVRPVCAACTPLARLLCVCYAPLMRSYAPRMRLLCDSYSSMAFESRAPLVRLLCASCGPLTRLLCASRLLCVSCTPLLRPFEKLLRSF